MVQSATTDFLTGVIEGFYGKPWTQAERFALFADMTRWGLNTYLYAPKDDLKHRALWRERYTPAEAQLLGELVGGCRDRGLHFIYALSPGLDIQYGRDADLALLQQRFQQMMELGVQHFALLFDDIPDRMEAGDVRRWGSFAAAQCHVANALFRWTQERVRAARFLFCPTPYCGRMAERQVGGAGYLETLGRALEPGIDVLWTGPEIVSREITVAHVRDLAVVLRRKPLIWDNLHANDYDGNRFYCGPYAGRPPELRSEVAGLLSNPNCEFPLNYVALATLAGFVRAGGTWDARGAYLAAMKEWLARFAAPGDPVKLEDLVLLGDCYYLPYEEGPEAEALFRHARDLIASPPTSWGDRAGAFRERAGRLRSLCGQLTELCDRPLFYALSRRVWELREELDLLDRCVETNAGSDRAEASCRSDFHLPGTCRGGLVRRLQRLLDLQPDGTFTPGQSGSVPVTTLGERSSTPNP